MKYTKEELQNTYGEVVSPEHAEFIIELCEIAGIPTMIGHNPNNSNHFIISNGVLAFYNCTKVSGLDLKQIAIPLPPKESVIEWKEGAVCYAGGRQWHFNDSVNPYKLVSNMQGTRLESYVGVINMPDFKLNTIKQRDSIKASELDTEQKYNDAVKVFELFGYERGVGYNTLGLYDFCFIAKNGHIGGCSERHLLSVSHRKITFKQLMAIGELKRLEIKRERQNQVDMLNMKSIEPNKQEVKMQKNKPVVAQVMIDLTERMEIGIKTYGEALRANNGRDALQDDYEEALDLACYLKQAMIERDNENTN